MVAEREEAGTGLVPKEEEEEAVKAEAKAVEMAEASAVASPEAAMEEE